MYLVREIFYCKPGKVKPMVEKLLAMNAISKRAGMPNMRIMTDVSAEQYWTVVGEMEVASLEAFEKMMLSPPSSDADQKEFEKIMAGYHDLIDSGRREIYKLEG
ncbi:MAG TPA: hypothetical protein VGQ44_18565 [Gemmatimonadaceae bacterium]|jgi:hypothetical protein|nr:hypothetical protein [Gemmatimonadaceae bacterium]